MTGAECHAITGLEFLAWMAGIYLMAIGTIVIIAVVAIAVFLWRLGDIAPIMPPERQERPFPGESGEPRRAK